METTKSIEKQLELVESYFVKYGCTALDINKNREKFEQRTTFQKEDRFYRADTAEFDESGTVWIVISCTEDEKFASVGVMDDIGAFEANLSDEEIEQEIKYALGIEEYPEDY